MKTSYKVLVAAGGSVAAARVPDVVKALLKINEMDVRYQLEIRVVVTEHAKHFYDASELPCELVVYDDSAEWAWKRRGDLVQHIELAKWADLMLVAPMNANTLAKVASGICDNLVTCIARAWEPRKPFLYCPAMNSRMWAHPVTTKNTDTLKSWGYQQIEPIVQLAMCGEMSMGAMAEISTIVERVMLLASERCQIKNLKFRGT